MKPSSPTPKGFIPPGFLTLLCEGNNNPYSANWSRRLRTSPKGHAVIGKGYDLTINGEKQIIQDLTDAGVPLHKAQLLAKAPTLNGFEASNFIAFYKNDIVLTKEQEQKLFDMMYKKAEAIMKSKLDLYAGKSEYISPYELAQYQWEILTDMIFCGDLNSSNEESVFKSLKEALDQHDPKVFDRVVLDVNYWRQLDVPEDRIRMRCIFINEWNSFTDLVNLPSQGTCEDESFVPMLLKFPELFSIEGFFVDLKKDSLNLVLKRNVAHPNGKKTPMMTGITLEELVIGLKLSFDKSIDASIVGGTLDPLDPHYPNNRRMKKEFYPDQYYRRQIIAGTKFAEVTYEVSKIVTQIASGCAIVDKGEYLEKQGEFEHLQAFKEIGIVPLESILTSRVRDSPLKPSARSVPKLKSKNALAGVILPMKLPNSPVNTTAERNENRIVKFWLVAKNIKDVNYMTPDGEYYSVSNVQLSLRPCRMVFTAQGEWEEAPIEDPEDPATIFAQKFNEKYSLIAKLFPVFKKVEQMYKSIIIAKWMSQKNFPIDMVMVNNYYQKGLQYISSPRKVIFGGHSAPNTPVKKGMGPLNYSIGYPPPDSRPGSRLSNFSSEASWGMNMSNYTPTKTSSSGWPEGISLRSPKKSSNGPCVYAGVLLDVNEHFSGKKGKDIKTMIESQIKNAASALEAIFLETFQIDYPFQSTMCKVCENYLKYSEIMSSVNGDYYCRLHHPFSCNHCFNIIKSNCLEVDGKMYHNSCIICKYCEKKITGKLVNIEDVYLHVQCSEEFLKTYTTKKKDKAAGSPKNRGAKNGNKGRFVVSFKF